MRREDIRDLTRAEPFVPFRIFLTNGDRFDVRHPEMIVATLGAALIPDDAGEGDDIISLVHIVKVKKLTSYGTLPGEESF